MEIEALLESYHAEAAKNATDITAVKAEVSKLIDKITAMQVGSATGTPNGVLPKDETQAVMAAIRGDRRISAAMTVGSDPDGGFSVLPTYSEQIDKVQRDQSPMRNHCRIIKISSAEFRELIDASDISSGWVGEADARPETTSLQFMERKIPVNEIYAMPKATRSLLDNSSVDIAAWLAQKSGDKFGRDEGAAFVSGNGVNRPMGFLSYPATTEADFTRAWGKWQYTPTGNATSFASTNPGDALVDLSYSLRAPYRANAVWMGSSDTARVIRKMKDGQGNYLWQPATVAGQPDLLMGKPWVTNEFMPAIGANAFPVAYGDFGRGYIIVGSTRNPDHPR